MIFCQLCRKTAQFGVTFASLSIKKDIEMAKFTNEQLGVGRRSRVQQKSKKLRMQRMQLKMRYQIIH